LSAKPVTVVIERPVADVFSYMNDIAREPEWQPQLREAEQLPPGPAAVGSRRRYASDFMGRIVRNTYVIRIWEPNRRIVLETTPDSAVAATSEIRWEAVAGGTRVTMSVDGAPKGRLKLLPRRLVEAAFKRELETALARLKERLEDGR
jgi:uncharacterized membrane protein